MNQLKIPFLSYIDQASEPVIVSGILNTLSREQIGCACWVEFLYKPEVSFVMAYSKDCIFIKYHVCEDQILAIHQKINEPVHKDSCVELFIALNNDTNYYNFEFNCLGVCHAAYGPDGKKRQLLPEESIKKIGHLTTLKTAYAISETKIQWELTIIIPFDVFCHHLISALEGTKCRMNVYKCGDDLPTPHYLCWSAIQSNTPNFHLPEFFGEARFMPS